MKVTLHRFGRNRRLVLILEWLTLWPTCGPLAVSSQRRDIAINPLPSPASSVPRGFKNHVHFQERRTYRGGAARRQGFGMRAFSGKAGKGPQLMVCAYSDRKTGSHFLRNTRGQGSEKAGFTGARGAIWPSYKRRIRRRHHGFRRGPPADLLKKRAGPLFAGYFCLNDILIAREAGPS